jgi:hypothetical protein
MKRKCANVLTRALPLEFDGLIARNDFGTLEFLMECGVSPNQHPRKTSTSPLASCLKAGREALDMAILLWSYGGLIFPQPSFFEMEGFRSFVKRYYQDVVRVVSDRFIPELACLIADFALPDPLGPLWQGDSLSVQ